MEAVHCECRLTFRSNLRLLNLAHFDSFSSNWPNRKKEHFSPESSYSCRQAAFLIEKLQHCRVGIERVYSCLFVCLFVKKKKKKRFSLLGQSSFRNTFGVFFSSGSHQSVSACLCVSHSYNLLMMLSLLLASWMHFEVSPGRGEGRYIFSWLHHLHKFVPAHTLMPRNL